MLRYAGLAVCGVAGGAGIGIYSQDEKFFRNVLMPIVLRTVDAERAHELGVFAFKHSLFGKSDLNPSARLKTQLLGLDFDTPVGIAAGFDKNGECAEGLARSGFGFVEVGSITPLPQDGNPKPRVFRLVEDEGVINRYGFNSVGLEQAYKNLTEYRSREDKTPCVLGINLGKK
mmetsp:Transcript_1078/g.1747  ORF Transcript_1078/g.1747 Transcript_1078/m.1747 type:complete len:173 (+) Transcript_1078:32-550(+)